jgi:hypothetical protein
MTYHVDEVEFDGIWIEGLYTALTSFDRDTTAESPLVVGWDYDGVVYLRIEGSKLINDSATGTWRLNPTEVMTLIFGGELTTGTDGMYTSEGFESTYFTAPSKSDYVGLGGIGYDFGGRSWGTVDFEGSKSDTSFAYTLTTAVLNLPNIDTHGFLNYISPFGLGWDADVWTMYKQSRASSEGTPHSGIMFWAANEWRQIDLGREGTTYTDYVGTEAGTESNRYAFGVENNPSMYGGMQHWENEWETADADGNYDAWFRNNLYAIAFGQEVVGFDYFDTMDTDGTTVLDANEVLHSNEVYRIQPMNGWTITSAQPQIATGQPPITAIWGSPYTINVSYNSNIKQVFAAKFHGTDPSESDESPLAGTPGSNSWPYGSTYPEEKRAMLVKFAEELELIADNYETSEWPKRLSNTVQRRRPIPNRAFSALGVSTATPLEGGELIVSGMSAGEY